MVVENNGSGINSGDSKNRPEANSGATNKKRASIPRMAPLLSRRSIIALVVGLAIGISLGLGYWIISPSLSPADPITLAEQDSSTPLIWPEFKGPYESTVQIQIVNPGSAYTYLGDLMRTAEYYSAKANSFPFLDFLAQELDEKAPTYSHSAEELDLMVSITNTQSDEVPVIEIQVTATTEEETLYLAAFIPTVFSDFLTLEENNLRLQQYELLVEDIEDIQQALLEAQEDLASYSLESATSSISSDPTYIALSAKVAALQTELGRQAEQMAMLIAIGDQSQAYLEAVTAVEMASFALAEARSELAVLEAQHNIDYTEQDFAYQVAQAKVDNLNIELARLSTRATTLLTESTEEPNTLDYIAVGTPSSPVPSIPDRIRGRDAILLGGILGICGAWVVLNFKWLAKGMPSSAVRREEETA
ncbi:MAG: hypothetical protein JSV77_08790 [Dehalococcoidales bacterium]|nr:MAG: hypothetical protein JSV77_08790 [Dehalococcoidales bacterium]